MIVYKSFAAALMLLALNLCCSRINEETGVLPEAAGGLDTKVLRLSDNYEPDHLLVKINDAADKELLVYSDRVPFAQVKAN